MVRERREEVVEGGRGGEGMPWEDFISWLDICHPYFQRYLGKRSSERNWPFPIFLLNNYLNDGAIKNAFVV